MSLGARVKEERVEELPTMMTISMADTTHLWQPASTTLARPTTTSTIPEHNNTCRELDNIGHHPMTRRASVIAADVKYLPGREETKGGEWGNLINVQEGIVWTGTSRGRAVVITVEEVEGDKYCNE